MNLGIQGKRVLVTGASRGIGRALALAFAREGAQLAITFHTDEAGAAETIASAGGGEMVRLDLGDANAIDAGAARLIDLWGGIDILVNNAVSWPGFPQPGERFETAPVERFRSSLRANLEGPYLLTRALVGPMRHAGWGRVVHVSTGLVEDGFAGASSYVAAKSGLHGLTRTMARELAPAGILTNLVMPGFTTTEGKAPPAAVLDKVRAATATGRTTAPDDVASLVLYLASAANTHVNGELIRVDGHFLAPS